MWSCLYRFTKKHMRVITQLTFCVSDISTLHQQMLQRRYQCNRPGTKKNHVVMWRKYFTFCFSYKLNHINPAPRTICLYIEHLAQEFKSYKSVCNYISAVKLLHKFLNVHPSFVDAFEVTLMLRAASLTMRSIPNRRPPVTPVMLVQICKLAATYGKLGRLVKFALTIAFYGFFRTSNLCPPTVSEFDATRQFTRADVRIAPPGLVIALKWSKTMQQARQPELIPIPASDNKFVDAVSAYKDMLKDIPAAPHSPLLLLSNGLPMTAPQLRTAFSTLLRKCGFDEKSISLHSLRCGGASASYTAGADFLDIQRQGSWTSSCFFQYVTRLVPEQSTVCSALTKAINSVQ